MVDFTAAAAAVTTAPKPPTTACFIAVSNAVKRFSAANSGAERFFSSHWPFFPTAESTGEALSKMENSVFI